MCSSVHHRVFGRLHLILTDRCLLNQPLDCPYAYFQVGKDIPVPTDRDNRAHRRTFGGAEWDTAPHPQLLA